MASFKQFVAGFESVCKFPYFKVRDNLTYPQKTLFVPPPLGKVKISCSNDKGRNRDVRINVIAVNSHLQQNSVFVMKNHLQTFSDSPIAFTMVAIEGNRQGDPFKVSDTYRVRLDDFWMGEYPVTQALWAYVMRGTDSAEPSRFKGADRPVERVTWNDIDQLFLPRLNDQTQIYRPEGAFYRLPTEVEWEYAARGGKYWEQYSFDYAGSNKLEEVGWDDENSSHETKVAGLKTPNLLGLYDMSGNVWEWCHDWYSNDYHSRVIKHPIRASIGSFHVFRGGSYEFDAYYCRSSFRGDSPPDYSYHSIGFRLVLSSSPVQ